MSPFLPILLPWVAAVALTPFDGRRLWPNLLATAVLASGIVATVFLLQRVVAEGTVTVVTGRWAAGVGVTLRVEVLGLLFALATQILLLLCQVSEFVSGIQNRIFPSITLFLAAGMTALYLTGDAFNFYVFFELAMVCGFVITGYAEKPRMIRAAVTFAVVNLIGSVLFLTGIVGLYRLTGTLDLLDLAAKLPQAPSKPRSLIAVLILAAFAIKLGLFPFHLWVSSVYRGTHPAIAALLSGALANIGAYGFLRFGAGLFGPEIETHRWLILALGGASILYGALVALSRRNAAEALAYSSISQSGYILLCLGIGGTGSLAGAAAFAVANGLQKGTLFVASGLRGPLVGAAFALAGIGLVGLPPSMGFVAKLIILRSALAEQRIVAIVVVVLGVALSYLYLFRIYQQCFWNPDRRRDSSPSPLASRIAVLAMGFLILILGLWPQPVLALSHLAARSLEEVAK